MPLCLPMPFIPLLSLPVLLPYSSKVTSILDLSLFFFFFLNWNSSELGFNTLQFIPESKLPSAVGEDVNWIQPFGQNMSVSKILMYTFWPSHSTYWRRKWQPTPVVLLGESHGQRSLVGYSPWGHKESDTTEYARILLIEICPKEIFTDVYEDTNEWGYLKHCLWSQTKMENNKNVNLDFYQSFFLPLLPYLDRR